VKSKKRSKSSLSQGETYREIGGLWDSHDLDAVWDQTTEADFSVDIRSEVTYYAIEACKTAGYNPNNHFRGVTKMVKPGSGAERLSNVNQDTFVLGEKA
jgi:hypothetical protein